MALLHGEENDHNNQDKRSNKGAEGRQTLKPEKAHLTSDYVIVAKFVPDHVLHRLVSSLSNVIKQVGRQTKIPV